MIGQEIFERGYIARLVAPTDRIGSTSRQVLEHSARTAVAAVASMLAARVLRLPQMYWAPITSLVIMQSSLGTTLAVSWQRFIGTAVGALLGALVASDFGTDMLVFGTSVFLLGLFCAGVGVDRSAYRFWGCYAGDRAARSANGACVASCLSSIRRSIDGNCSGAGNDRSMARKGRDNKQATGQQHSLTNPLLLLASGPLDRDSARARLAVIRIIWE
jgi:hypothetical protein